MGKCLFTIGAALVSILPSFVVAEGRNEAQREPKQVPLWAGISVAQPIFGEGGVAKLKISFGVVNDGSAMVDPRIGASHLSINGGEPKDWLIVINNGLRTPEFQALPPGHFPFVQLYARQIFCETRSLYRALVGRKVQSTADHASSAPVGTCARLTKMEPSRPGVCLKLIAPLG